MWSLRNSFMWKSQSQVLLPNTATAVLCKAIDLLFYCFKCKRNSQRHCSVWFCILGKHTAKTCKLLLWSCFSWTCIFKNFNWGVTMEQGPSVRKACIKFIISWSTRLFKNLHLITVRNLGFTICLFLPKLRTKINVTFSIGQHHFVNSWSCCWATNCWVLHKKNYCYLIICNIISKLHWRLVTGMK